MPSSPPPSADGSNANPPVPKPTASLTMLGTGTSAGVPMIGCDCEVCTSSDPRNRRTRSGVLLDLPDGPRRRHVVIDTAPELRLQLIRTGVGHVDAALFTHAHADHIMGLDDLRICSLRASGALPLYAETPVQTTLQRTFPYAFAEAPRGAHAGAVPQYELRTIGLEPFELFGVAIQPLRLWHGRLPVLGFRIGDTAFCTDCSRIDDSAWDGLSGVRTLIIDALRYAPHPTHFNVEQALAAIERIGPRRAFLTHLAHEVDHSTLLAELPKHVRPAFDGMTIAVDLERPSSEAHGSSDWTARDEG